MKKNDIIKALSRLTPLACLGFWVGVWWVAALLLGKPLLLPTPWQTLKTLWALLKTAPFWQALLFSFLRIFGGIAAAFLLGVWLALLTAKFRALHHLISPLMNLFKSVPVASIVFLLLLFIGRDTAPFFMALMPTLPIVWSNMEAGLCSTDEKLLEMARVFDVKKSAVFWHVRFQGALPFLGAACRSAIGLGFKAGVAAEVLCVPTRSLGRAIYESKLYLHTNELFATTLAVILLSMAIEKLTLLLLPKEEKDVNTK